MIDVVYKLGNGSRFDDAELRYSLRSLSNFRDLGKIYVVGKKPAWIKNVIHIPAGDPYKSNKDANIINKIILAATHSDITANIEGMTVAYNLPLLEEYAPKASLAVLLTAFYVGADLHKAVRDYASYQQYSSSGNFYEFVHPRGRFYL